MQTFMKKNTVTKEQVQENMKDIIVRTLDDFGKPTTYVTVRMKNGFTLRESTTCVDPANYDENIGKEVCLKKIEDKVWFLLGYALQDKIANTPNVFSIPVSDIEIPAGLQCRFFDACTRGDIKSLGDLLRLGSSNLLKFQHVGHKTVIELRKSIKAKYNIDFI